MRIVLAGAGSFIARQVRQACKEMKIETLSLPHDAAIADKLISDDMLINFAISPIYKIAPYDKALDFDLKAAEAAAHAGAHFTMISTRKVYSLAEQWPCHEDLASGDGSFYGQNKLITEKTITRLSGRRPLILRLSNVFGFEYAKETQRSSFFGSLLTRLRTEGCIQFNMHPDSRRDFIPVASCAKSIVSATVTGLCGTYNLGAGFPISCGQIAHWVMEGYGAGKIQVLNPAILDEFYLDMRKWNTQLSASSDLDDLKISCINIGRKLRNA